MTAIETRAKYLDVSIDSSDQGGLIACVVGDELWLYFLDARPNTIVEQFGRLIREHAEEIRGKVAVLKKSRSTDEWPVWAAVAAGWMLKGRGVTDIYVGDTYCVGYTGGKK